MSALPNFNRFAGFGDLSGNSRHPNSPDYVEPSYGDDDAECDVGRFLAKQDEVGELVADVRGALPLLSWLAQQDIPAHLRGQFRVLQEKAGRLDRMVDAQRELMS